MEQRADLHIHTTASDGGFTPSQVVEAAAKLGLTAIAITDHDTIEGLDEALAVGEKLGVRVVPGVEISTIYQDKIEAHILGYFMDHHDRALIDQLDVLKNARWNRGKQMVEQLRGAGLDIEFERVADIAGGGAIGRPHVARAICEIGAACSINAAFGRFLLEGGPGFVARHKVTPFEAVRMILEAGGVACCAHVAKLKHDELVVELIEHGMAAIEAHHPDHTSANSRFYKKFAQRRGLIVTGGSDAHCLDSHRQGIGQVTVDCEVVDQLQAAANRREQSQPG